MGEVHRGERAVLQEPRGLALLLAAAALAGCGGGDGKAAPAAKPKHPKTVDATTCRDLRAPEALRRISDELTVRLVAPPDHSEREVRGTIANSLKATCSQPELPGVSDPADYKPVKPVLRGIQRDFDEEEMKDAG